MVQRIFVIVFVLIIMVMAFSNKLSEKYSDDNEVLNLGHWSKATLNEIIYEAAEFDESSERVDFISRKFLDTPYKAKTLIGDEKTGEKLVINFEAFDCMTFTDKVIAMSLAKDFDDFKNKIKRFRYKNAEISFINRNHFFSDWLINNPETIKDITLEIGGKKTKSVIKNLNQKEDGSKYLSGLGFIERKINYIEAEDFTDEISRQLKTGDLVAYFSEKPGLDVSHIGIAIEKDGGIYVRNASSKKSITKVIDEKLLDVLKQIPGLVIYRLKD